MSNPFDLPGPEFLTLYILVLAIATLFAWTLRWLLQTPGGTPPPEADHLGRYEIAYLLGGPRRAIDAALASLVRQEKLGVDKASKLQRTWDPLESTCRHASLSIL